MDYKNQSNPVSKRIRTFPIFLGLALVVMFVLGQFSNGILLPVTTAAASKKGEQVEPQAGTWDTWVLESGSQLRLPPQPDRQKTKEEVDPSLPPASTFTHSISNYARFQGYETGWVIMTVDHSLSAGSPKKALSVLAGDNTPVIDSSMSPAWLFTSSISNNVRFQPSESGLMIMTVDHSLPTTRP